MNGEETDEDSPYPNATVTWWNVLQFGNTNRLTQIAIQVFVSRSGHNELWIRNKHDAIWSDWKKIG